MSIASGWLDGVREFGLILSDFDPLFNSCSMHVQTSEHTQGARERERERERDRDRERQRHQEIMSKSFCDRLMLIFLS